MNNEEFIYFVHRYDIDQGLKHVEICYFCDLQEEKL